MSITSARQESAVKNPPASKPSAKPGTKAPTAQKEKKAKIVKVAYAPQEGQAWAGVKGEGDARQVLLTRRPDDFDPKRHKPLGRKQFLDEASWFDYGASVYDKRAADLREKANDARTLGSSEDRAAARKLKAQVARFQEQMAVLSGKGYNVAELLKGLTNLAPAGAQAAVNGQ